MHCFSKSLIVIRRYNHFTNRAANHCCQSLTRDNTNTKKLTTYFRAIGLTQLIDKMTRPSKNKGTCIDWILTNCPFIHASGVSNVLISDHLAVYCIRKKVGENTRWVYRTVRDVKNYDFQVFSNLLSNTNWE